VFVDCWTSVGGSQFLDSPATGMYHTHLCEEVVPWVDGQYRTLAAAAHRGIAGKSSGGYGAMVTCMLRPDLFGGMADHAGDAVFENCYLPDFRKCARVLRDRYEGSYDRFWADFRSRPAMSRDGDGELANAWAMAAAYSADSDGTVRLPYDTATGMLIPRCGSSGCSGTRCAWLPATPTHSARSAPSSSTAAGATSGTSTSGARPSGGLWSRSG